MTFDAADPAESEPPAFKQAECSLELRLPVSRDVRLKDVRTAIRREHEDATQWKRLRCQSVRQVGQHASSGLYRLTIGHAVEFEWTWEGATAFRPTMLKSLEQQEAGSLPTACLNAEIDDAIVWSGELIEVDEARSCLYVLASDPRHIPCRGWFYVRPFEFLECLNSVYNEPLFADARSLLEPRLAAACGQIHPKISSPAEHSLPELQEWWDHSWSVLWGPPGTGKTFTTGRQVAAAIADEAERVLVVSTTNRATDAVALAIGQAAREQQLDLSAGRIRRIGKGASLSRFEAAGLAELLQGTETEFLQDIEQRQLLLAAAVDADERAILQQQIRELKTQMSESSTRSLLNANVQVVVSTAFRATLLLRNDDFLSSLECGLTPFTTIVIDEAGLLSRAAIAALSLLAGRRVVLAGDSRQLAPISRIARVLEPAQATWLASSGLSHLNELHTDQPGVHVLLQQYRMHPDICEVISKYQYSGMLNTAATVQNRDVQMASLLQNQPRAIWYVLDEDSSVRRPALRHDRGPGNRSWVRHGSLQILKKLFRDDEIRNSQGLLVTPFRAHAATVNAFFAQHKAHRWTASTVHSQQGAEAEIVLFDTVNAGSTGWPWDEWTRMVNVAISRAREAVLVIASRAEMEEPFLLPLTGLLSAQVLELQRSKLRWRNVSKNDTSPATGTAAPSDDVTEPSRSTTLGSQLSRRKQMRPILSREQERLCALDPDGKPRLVRGVAGSGKTVVLAHWLAATIARLQLQPEVRIWVVFANRSLQSLIAYGVREAWDRETAGRRFPVEQIALHHIKELLEDLLPEVGLAAADFGFQYDDAAAAFLQQQPAEQVTARCDALFVDEAQDMGPSTLKLLTALVRQSDQDDSNSRAVNIFYDNAQNIYRRGTPNWSQIGLGMRGRSVVMKESYRSTRPITEYALNVLYRLQPPTQDADHRELVQRGLIEREVSDDEEWWSVRFNQVEGPRPNLLLYPSIREQYQAIANHCVRLIRGQQVLPSDICFVYVGRSTEQHLIDLVAPVLQQLGVELSIQKNRSFRRQAETCIATSPHSFKGHEAEIILIPGVEHYTATRTGILAAELYVAMTRARSILHLYGQQSPAGTGQKLVGILQDCMKQSRRRPTIALRDSQLDDSADLVARVGVEHRSWLKELTKSYQLSLEPVTAANGQVIADPLFVAQDAERQFACFAESELPQTVAETLSEAGVEVLHPGQSIPAANRS